MRGRDQRPPELRRLEETVMDSAELMEKADAFLRDTLRRHASTTLFPKPLLKRLTSKLNQASDSQEKVVSAALNAIVALYAEGDAGQSLTPVRHSFIRRLL